MEEDAKPTAQLLLHPPGEYSERRTVGFGTTTKRELGWWWVLRKSLHMKSKFNCSICLYIANESNDLHCCSMRWSFATLCFRMYWWRCTFDECGRRKVERFLANSVITTKAQIAYYEMGIAASFRPTMSPPPTSRGPMIMICCFRIQSSSDIVSFYTNRESGRR